MPRFNSPFNTADIDEIRRQATERILNVRAWADARGVSLETIRRIARGDTYRDPSSAQPQHGFAQPLPGGPRRLAEPLPGGPRLPAQPLPDSRPSLEPTSEELAASLKRLADASGPPQPREVNQLINELTAKARADR